jgi:hypothetical protein
LKRVHNDNDSGLAKKNVMTEPLDNMHCCQSKLLNVRIVEFQPNQASAKVINNMLLEKIILLNQDHVDGRLCSSQIQQEISVIIGRPEQRGRHKGIFQCFKRALSGFIPTEWDSLFQETHKPFSDLGVIHDKTPKKVHFPL